MALDIGDKAPHFEAINQEGVVVNSAQWIGQQKVVLYFYPKDDTPGCTQQACQFRDAYEDFVAAGAVVIGISADGSKSHQKFADKYQLPFILLSDRNKQAQKLYQISGYLLGLIPGRVTFVIDSNGIIQHKMDQLSAKNHMKNALEAVKKCK